MIRLRAIALDDYDRVLAWSRDKLFCASNEWESDRDEQELYRWWEACVTKPIAGFVRKGIEYQGQLVGYADLADIRDRTAELGIAIGASEYWGIGIGFEASRQMMDYGINQFGIRLYRAEANEHNLASRKMLEKLGYREIGKAGHEQYRGRIGRLIQYEYRVADDRIG